MTSELDTETGVHAEDVLSTASPAWNEMNTTKYMILYPTFSVALRLLLFPPYLIKARLQVQQDTAKYRGTADAFVKIVKSEGVRGLYRGVTPSLLGISVGQAYMVTYEYTRSQFREELASHNWSSARTELASNLSAAALASVASQTLGVPLDIVTQRLMVQSSTPASRKRGSLANLTRMFKRIWKAEGLRGFYRGYWIQQLQFAPSSAIYWAGYHSLCSQISAALEKNKIDLGWAKEVKVQATAALLASTASTVLTHPLDVLRTRIQVDITSEPSLRVAFNKLLAEDGWKGFGRGLVARLISSAPASVLFLVGYEAVKRYCIHPAPAHARDTGSVGIDFNYPVRREIPLAHSVVEPTTFGTGAPQ